MFGLTTIEWLLPSWIVAAVVIIALFGRLLRRGTPLKEFAAAGRLREKARLRALGGLRCPSDGGGTITVTMPLVRLTCYDTHLRLGPSLGVLGPFVPSWAFPLSAIERAEPVKGSIAGAGARFWVAGVPVVFLTSDPFQVLDAVESGGVPVNREWGKTEWRSVG